MNILITAAVCVISWGVGVIGFAQIVGSLQSKDPRYRGTMILWILIVLGTVLLVYRFLPDRLIACLIGLGISFVQVRSSGRIQ